jgi:hypothetical protein
MGDQAVIPQVFNADNNDGRLTPILTFSNRPRRTVESYERELIECRSLGPDPA